MTTPITPLENWIKRKIGLQETDGLSRQALSHYQLWKLQETLAYTRSHSPFYRTLLASLPHHTIQNLDDLLPLPFTTADDLCDQALQFLCVSQSDVTRVVTLQTWEARHKRLYFTDEDLELTIDFFHHGMSGIVQPGHRVLILMPGERPGSVGDLLVRALGRMDVQGIVHGLVQNPGRTIEEILERRVDCLVGIPVQVLALARHREGARLPPGQIKTVLLSSDYVPQAIVDEVEQVWRCRVFEHYGMTEASSYRPCGVQRLPPRKSPHKSPRKIKSSWTSRYLKLFTFSPKLPHKSPQKSPHKSHCFAASRNRHVKSWNCCD